MLENKDDSMEDNSESINLEQNLDMGILTNIDFFKDKAAIIQSWMLGGRIC